MVSTALLRALNGTNDACEKLRVGSGQWGVLTLCLLPRRCDALHYALMTCCCTTSWLKAPIALTLQFGQDSLPLFLSSFQHLFLYSKHY